MRIFGVDFTSAPCHPLGIRVRLGDGLERALVGDGAGDLLYGLPAGGFGAEGWITSS
jgi:hypothetical protein